MAQEYLDRMFNWAMKTLIDPEVTRRLEAGAIDGTWRLWAGQVLFKLGEPPAVRLNEEVSVLLRGQLPQPYPPKGSPISIDALDSIDFADLHETDEDASHITLLRYRGDWFVAIDAVHNKATARRYLELADEFLGVARQAKRKKRLRGFIENLHAAVEHLGRCLLLTRTDDVRTRESKVSHNFIQVNLNQAMTAGAVAEAHVQLLNRLADLRPKARYRPDAFELGPKEATSMLRKATRLRKEVAVLIQRRRPASV